MARPLPAGARVRAVPRDLEAPPPKGGRELGLLVAAPEGLAKIQHHHPDIRIVTAAIDNKLNEKGYILPGLGDAGDRIYGTE